MGHTRFTTFRWLSTIVNEPVHTWNDLHLIDPCNPSQPLCLYLLTSCFILSKPSRRFVMQTPPLSDSQRSLLQSGAGRCRTPRRPSTRPCLRDTTSKEQLPVVRLSRSFDNVWDETEVGALVQFVLLMCKPDKWPTHKRMVFWNKAGKFVQDSTRTLHLRSGELWYNIITIHQFMRQHNPPHHHTHLHTLLGSNSD